MKSIITIVLLAICFTATAQIKKTDKKDSIVVVPISPADQADIAELQKQLEPLQKQVDAINIQINTIIKMVLRHNVEPIEVSNVKKLEYAPDKLTVTKKE